MQAVKKKPRKKTKTKTTVRIAKPVNRFVTTSPAKLKAALPKRPKCRVDGRKHPDGGKFVCGKAGRSRGLCVNHYNMLSRLVRRRETTWKEQEKKGLALPAGQRAMSQSAILFLAKKGKDKKK